MAKHTKVFCIGFMKTGTTTMNRALTILGYRVSHNSWKLLRPIMKGDWGRVKRHAQEWDALEDNPIPLIYRELDKMFPNNKFILTVRPSEDWYQSVAHHIGNHRSPMHEWVFGRGKGIPSQNKEHTIRIYENHIAEVKAYFRDRPQDLLVYDLKDHSDWNTLCNFLDQPIPDAPYPHANKSNYAQSKYAGRQYSWRRVRKRLKNPIQLFYYNMMGWIPNR